MKVLLSDLITFVPQLKRRSAEELRELLSNLGFEVESFDGAIFDLSITPNRGDAMSALGVARDLAAFYGETLPSVGDDEAYRSLPAIQSPLITISAKAVVPQYHAIVLDAVRIEPSTGWLLDAVKALGWRPINNLVDLTNVLMDRFGQPLHAFDLDAIAGEQLTVRVAEAGETVATLDGAARQLPEGALVIADRDGLIDLAGIMGGASSEIRPDTKRVLLQAALFDRSSIRATTNATGLRTQAAIRYERGIDPSLGPAVLARVAELIKHDSSGIRVVGRVSGYEQPHRPTPISYAPAKSSTLLGMKLSATEQRLALTRLGCGVSGKGQQLSVTPPSWRYDLVIWQDLAEEVARMKGLGPDLPATPLPPLKGLGTQSHIERAEGLKDALIQVGFSEALTYSFTSRELLEALEFEPGGELANPLNPTLKFLRPSLMPNLASVVAANAAFDPHLLFEVGHVFHGEQEEERLAVVIAGQTQPTAAWLTRIADAFGVDSAALQSLGVMVELSGDQRERLKIRKGKVSLIEWPLQALLEQSKLTGSFAQPGIPVRYRPLSKYPVVSRDVSLLTDSATGAISVADFIGRFSALIEDVELFDEFSSPKLGEGKKSIAFHIWYADRTRTLREEEVVEVHEALVSALETTFNATRR